MKKSADTFGEDLGFVMQSMSGRRVLRRMLAMGCLSTTGMTASPTDTAYNLGIKHIATWLDAEMRRTNLDLYVMLIREDNDDTKSSPGVVDE